VKIASTTNHNYRVNDIHENSFKFKIVDFCTW